MARGGGTDAVVFEHLGYIGMFTHDLQRSREFFVSRLGLRIREESSQRGYVVVGVGERGADAGLALIEPTSERWRNADPDAVSHVSEPVSSFRATNVAELEARLRERGVAVRLFETKGHPWIHFADPDGNTFVAHEDPWAQGRATGFTALDYVNVVTNDEDRAGAFFTNVLRMHPVPFPGWAFVEYRVTPDGTAVVPFAPTPDMYEGWTDPGNLEKDLARAGEDTQIVFVTADLSAVRDRLRGSGVGCRVKADHPVWGGPIAEFRDPDGNGYLVFERRSVRLR